MRENGGAEHCDYPYVSPCQGELNYVKPADTPIVFGDLVRDPDTGAHGLVYAATQRVDFDPSSLVLSVGSGRLYHPVSHRMLDKSARARHGERPPASRMALLKSHLTTRIAQSIRQREGGGGVGGGGDDDDDDVALELEWEGERWPIRSIP